MGYIPWGHKESDTTEVTEHILWNMGYAGIFPGGSIGKEIACNAGDLGSTPGQEDPLEKEMATYSSILAWRNPWTEEPGGPQSMGLQSQT